MTVRNQLEPLSAIAGIRNTATGESFQLAQVERSAQPPKMNAQASALRTPLNTEKRM
jgi:hypothetical protein